MRKNFADFMDELGNENCDLDAFLQKNESKFTQFDPKRAWGTLTDQSALTKNEIINRSEISYAFFYDIINGRKMPSRDKVMRLALALNIAYIDCQEILKGLKHAPLSAKDRRDCILLYALEHSCTPAETSELLLQHGEEALK